MKITSLVIFLFLTLLIRAQVSIDSLNSIEFIVGINNNFRVDSNQNFTLTKIKEGQWKLMKDSVLISFENINLIDSSLIEIFNIESINNKRKLYSDLRIDSLWLVENYDSLYSVFKNIRHNKCKCMKASLKDLKLIQREFYLLEGPIDYTIYPYLDIKLKFNNSDFNVTTRSQNYFMNPYIFKNEKLYSVKLSLLLGEILGPEAINYDLLIGYKNYYDIYLFQHIVEQVYISNCKK